MDVAGILRAKGGEVCTVGPGAAVAEAVSILNARRIGALVVTEGGALAGIVSERDIVSGLAEKGADFLDCALAECMTTQVVTCAPTDSDREVLALMTDRRCRHLPVLDGGALVGIVSIGDVVKSRIDGIVAEADALRDYIVRG